MSREQLLQSFQMIRHLIHAIWAGNRQAPSQAYAGFRGHSYLPQGFKAAVAADWTALIGHFGYDKSIKQACLHEQSSASSIDDAPFNPGKPQCNAIGLSLHAVYWMLIRLAFICCLGMWWVNGALIRALIAGALTVAQPSLTSRSYQEM